MFNFFLSVNIFKVSFLVTCKSRKNKKKKNGLHKEQKWLANMKGVYTPSLQTATLQKQKHFKLNILKS